MTAPLQLLTPLFALLAIAALAAPSPGAGHSALVIVEAGAFNHRTHPDIPLSPGRATSFCPRKYSHKGFSVDCRGSGVKAPVTFFINGQRGQTEQTPPFAINGDFNYYRKAWNYAGPPTALIECRHSGGPSVKATIRLECSQDGPAMGSTYQAQKPPAAPSTIATPTPSEKDSANATLRGKCVVIQARSVGGNLPQGWSNVDGGIKYVSKNNLHGVEAAGTAPLTYYFSVPEAARYAVTLDMTTRHATEYNDVFLRFNHGRGFMLEKPRQKVFGGRNFLKAYHNRNGRATEAFSVDKNPHAFSTADKLTPGKKYEITVGARSSKIILHRIVLFPCEGEQCEMGNKFLREMSAKCM